MGKLSILAISWNLIWHLENIFNIL
jgi:hypothetical protein